jgi:hypothetical protein
LREGSLYIKISLSKAEALVRALEVAGALTGGLDAPNPARELLIFLRTELYRATNQSLFVAVSSAEAEEDIKNLRLVEAQDDTELVRKFRECLEAGLRNDPQVDWISRVGGPKPDAGLKGLRRAEPRPRKNPNLLDISLF